MSDMKDINIAANRSAKKYTRGEYAKRLAWSICFPLFRFSPRRLFGWRNFLLKLFGAKIGARVHIYPSAIIYMPWNLTIADDSSIGEHAYIYNIGQITVGKCVTLSQRSHLCAGTHDYNDQALPLLKLPINVNDSAWVCADAFVGPGITIGVGAVVGARAVVVKNVGDWEVVVGNPAKKIKMRHIA